jgi:hypothetical protein
VPESAIAQMIADSQSQSGEQFGARYGLKAGYMTGTNRYFERVGMVPAAWNRLVFYDGGQFHSADVRDDQPFSTDPRHGRLTLNGFFVCKRILA